MRAQKNEVLGEGVSFFSPFVFCLLLRRGNSSDPLIAGLPCESYIALLRFDFPVRFFEGNLGDIKRQSFSVPLVGGMVVRW